MSDFAFKKSVVILEDTCELTSPASTVTFECDLFSASLLVGGVQACEPRVCLDVLGGRVMLSIMDGKDGVLHDDPIASFVLTPDGKWQQQST